MATIEKVEKKYLSLEGLKTYDTNIKALIGAADAATLEAAENYANELADNYEPAGAIETLVTKGQVKTNTDAIEIINNENTGILKHAKDYADGKDKAIGEAKAAADQAQETADQAQSDVDALTAADGKVTVLEGQVAALIAGTYDDTEVRGLIQTNADDIDILEGRADALEGQMATLVGEDTGKSARTIANEELAKQLITENAAENLNELQEIAAWIQAHPGDAAAMNKAITDLEALVGVLPEGVTATTVVGYIQEVITAENDRAVGAEKALSDRLDVVEGQLGTGEGTVDAKIAAAKQEAINTAAGDATSKANAAEANAKAYTDGEIDKIEAVLPGIETNAGDIEALGGRMGSVEDRTTAVETSLATGGATATAIVEAKKAGTDAQGAVEALAAGAVAGLRTDVDALMNVSYVEITAEEINKMFTTTAA